MELERRILPSSDAEFRILSEDGKDYLEGNSIVFNKRSLNLGWGKRKFYEIILPSALDGAKMDEIICKYNHDMNRTLGTTWANTLTFEKDNTRVRYKVLLPDTENGREVKVLAERGDLRGNSFEFMPAENGMLWSEIEEDGEVITICTVTRIEGVYDFAPVMRPAYPDTNGSITVSKRSQDSYNEYIAKRDAEQAAIEKTPTEQPEDVPLPIEEPPVVSLKYRIKE